MKFILGQKLEMSQIFDKEGKVIPVTLIEAGPCSVTQVKTKAKDKYEAIQIGFLPKKKRIKKTEKGKEFRHLREFKGDEPDGSSLPSPLLRKGSVIDVSVFQEGDMVKVSGISKGKGFQGAVKRWGFSGRDATHGVKHEHRTLGSVGTSFPEHVAKGRKMPGQTGRERVTVKNLKIVKIDKENNLIVVKGAVPGRRGTLLEIKE